MHSRRPEPAPRSGATAGDDVPPLVPVPRAAHDGPTTGAPLVRRRRRQLTAVVAGAAVVVSVTAGVVAVARDGTPAPVPPPAATDTPATVTPPVVPTQAASPATVTPDEARAAVAAELEPLFAARANALLGRDRAAFLAASAPGTAATAHAALFDATAAVPFGVWRERVETAGIRPARPDADRYTVPVVREHRLADLDPGPLGQERVVTVERTAQGWRIVDDRPADGSRALLWDSGPVVAVRGERSMVLGHPGDEGRMRVLAGLADEAVREVTDVWGDDWRRSVVVLLPNDADGLGALLDAAPSRYDGIAALAVAELVDNGRGELVAADRVVVHPHNFDRLSAAARQVLLTHEVTHVATRDATGPASPVWLVEGIADYVAFRDAGVDDAVAARDLARQVAAGRLPDALPGDDAFHTDADDLTVTYELGWFAVRHIVERTSEEKLFAFYRAVGEAGDEDPAAVTDAFRDVLGTTEDVFVRSWRSYLTHELG